MKRKLLTSSIIAMFTTYASASFVVMVNDTNNNFDVVGYTDVSTSTEWTEISTDCVYDITEEDIYYGDTETQVETCTLTEEQITTVERNYDSGLTEIVDVSVEERTSDTITELLITGTYLSASCKDLLEFDNTKATGTHTIKFEDGTTYSTYCDMDTDGGGWTRLDNSVLTNSNYSIDYDIVAGEKSFSSSLLLVGDVSASGAVDMTVSINLPFNYSQFYLNNYKVKGANEDGHSYDFSLNLLDYNWSSSPTYQTSTNGYCGCGDVAFGSLNNSTPTTSFYNEGQTSGLVTETASFGANNEIFDLSINSNDFTIRPLDSGTQNENIYPWYSGYIFVR